MFFNSNNIFCTLLHLQSKVSMDFWPTVLLQVVISSLDLKKDASSHLSLHYLLYQEQFEGNIFFRKSSKPVILNRVKFTTLCLPICLIKL